MKHSKFVLILSIFIGCSSICYGNTSEFQNKLEKVQLSGPSSVAAKANKNSSFGSSYSGDINPMINGMLNGMTQMPGMSNTYDAAEQIKQQADYAKQQENYEKNW